jgi:hypothetical protein
VREGRKTTNVKRVLLFGTIEFLSEEHKEISCPIKKLDSIQNQHTIGIYGANVKD